MISATPEQLNAVKFNTDLFVALSKIGFSSIERLTSLHLKVTRAVLEDSVASALPARESKGLHHTSGPIPEVLGKDAVAYFQGVQEIAIDVQKEINNLMTAFFSSQGKGGRIGASNIWSKGFDVYRDFGQQITRMTEANSKAVGDATARITHVADVPPMKKTG